MKRQILERLRMPPRLRMADLFLTLVPALLWLALLYGRPWILKPRCAQNPASCNPQELLTLDRLSVGLDSTPADQFSYATQNLSGFLAMGVPLLWHAGLAVTGTSTPAVALIGFATDLGIFAQTAAWNGLLTEASHDLYQRPRPFVYANPEKSGDASNYTSFYSGHTSFSAAAMTSLVLILMGRGAPALVLLLAGGAAEILVFLTAMCRVMAGRHFVTDVLTGAALGFSVALLVALRHRRSAPPS